MTNWRPTKVQADVLARLRDEWHIGGMWSFEIRKDGEAPRHVADATVMSLARRGVLRQRTESERMVGERGHWILAAQPDANGSERA